MLPKSQTQPEPEARIEQEVMRETAERLQRLIVSHRRRPQQAENVEAERPAPRLPYNDD